MNEVCQISITIIGGVLIYVLGQIMMKFIIDPLQKQKLLIGEIAADLIFYADIIANPGDDNIERRKEAKKQLRQKASLLRSYTYLIPSYQSLTIIKFAISKSSITIASRNLVAISNNLGTSNNLVGAAIKNVEWRDEIKQNLGLPMNM